MFEVANFESREFIAIVACNTASSNSSSFVDFELVLCAEKANASMFSSDKIKSNLMEENLKMDLLEHLINERPILFARYVGYLVIAIVSIITALIKRNKKK